MGRCALAPKQKGRHGHAGNGSHGKIEALAPIGGDGTRECQGECEHGAAHEELEELEGNRAEA